MVRVIVADECQLVLVVKDSFGPMTMIYCLNGDGEIIEYIEVRDDPKDLKIDHLFVLSFTTKQFHEMLYKIRFNCIFEPDYIEYNDIKKWRMSEDEVFLARLLGKIKHIKDYMDCEEFETNAKRCRDWINARPTPIEQRDDDIHQQGRRSRQIFIREMRKWLR